MRRADGGMAIGSAVGAVGTATAAVLGTLCCAGPAVVAILGTGGAIVAAGIEPYRPYLLGASALMLGFGFWRAYRPVKAGDGSACSVRSGRVVRTILWVAAVLTIASAIVPRVLG